MMDGALAAAIASLERHHPQLAGRLTVADLHRAPASWSGEEMQGTLEELRRGVVPARAGARSGATTPSSPRWLADELLARGRTWSACTPTSSRWSTRLLERGHQVGAITNGNFPFERLDLARAVLVRRPRRGGGRGEAGAGAVRARGRAGRPGDPAAGCTSATRSGPTSRARRRSGCGRVAEPRRRRGAAGRGAGRRDPLAARAARRGRSAAGRPLGQRRPARPGRRRGRPPPARPAPRGRPSRRAPGPPPPAVSAARFAAAGTSPRSATACAAAA